MSAVASAAIEGAARIAPALALPLRALGRVPYRDALDAMQRFTAGRTASTADELWLLEHPPVYTAGLAARPEHFPRESLIPLEHVDRGGQITYHGPGQAVVYVLVDLRRRGLTVRGLVHRLEQAVVDLLAEHGVAAGRRPGAPGVYVGQAKIAALGLRVKKGCTYHGLSLNVDLDLTPFSAIDPCGYPGLPVARTCDLGIEGGVDAIGCALADQVARQLAG